jgi:hypothetical protein
MKALFRGASIVVLTCGPLTGDPKITTSPTSYPTDRIGDLRGSVRPTLSAGCLRRYCSTGSALVATAMPYCSAVVMVSVDRCKEPDVS